LAPERLDTGAARQWDAEPLVHAIHGLHREACNDRASSLTHHWVELIHGYVSSFAGSQRGDDRITRAWKTISAKLRHPWSVEEMASAATMSAEHFRRLCLKEFGCSPMKRLTILRIEKAADLIRSTDLKIDAVCDEVGYEYRSTFSNLFTRMYGVRPSVFRDSRGVGAG
jgi:transcriptional regulator GlxA family with amidase domain